MEVIPRLRYAHNAVFRPFCRGIISIHRTKHYDYHFNLNVANCLQINSTSTLQMAYFRFFNIRWKEGSIPYTLIKRQNRCYILQLKNDEVSASLDFNSSLFILNKPFIGMLFLLMQKISKSNNPNKRS